MKYLIYALAIVFLLSLNLGLFELVQIKGVMPNLLFLFAFSVALERYSDDFLFTSFVAGLFLDFYSGVFFGSFTVTFLLMGLLIQLLLNNLLAQELTWKFILVMFLASFVFLNVSLWGYMAVVYTFKLAKFYLEPFNLTQKFFWELLLNFLLLYPTFWFTAKIKNAIVHVKNYRQKVI